MDKKALLSRPWLFLALVLLLMSSCISQKRLRYLQEHKSEAGMAVSDTLIRPAEIRPHDLLHVQVFSASSDLYKTPGFEVSTNLGTTASIYLQGYAVEPDGTLKLPVLGTFQAAGRTLPELREEIAAAARQLISLDADVMLRLVNFRVSVLGEVRKPGVIEVYDYRLSILEAIARSGDLTVYGNRNNVMLVREMNGTQKVFYLDLTDRDLLTSPHFYLQNHDVIYVQPLDAKSYGFAQVQWGVIISSVSTLIAILALVTRPN